MLLLVAAAAFAAHAAGVRLVAISALLVARIRRLVHAGVAGLTSGEKRLGLVRKTTMATFTLLVPGESGDTAQLFGVAGLTDTSVRSREQKTMRRMALLAR
jgi:hypothetical protein